MTINDVDKAKNEIYGAMCAIANARGINHYMLKLICESILYKISDNANNELKLAEKEEKTNAGNNQPDN